MKYLKKYEDETFQKIENIEIDIKTINFYNTNGKKVYKGIAELLPFNIDGYDFYVDPTLTKRITKGPISEFISHYKLNILDNYGDRRHSLIGTSSEKIANKWGKIYEVIPTKDEIFICPGDDFNHEEIWKNWNKIFNSRLSQWYFIDVIECIKNYLFPEKEIKIFPDTSEISFLDENIELIKTKNPEKKDFKMFSKIQDDAYNLFYLLKNYNSLNELLNDLLNLEKNGFKKIKYSEYQKSNEYKNNEVWFNCKCVLKRI